MRGSACCLRRMIMCNIIPITIFKIRQQVLLLVNLKGFWMVMIVFLPIFIMLLVSIFVWWWFLFLCSWW
ncbi:hypothetical protein LDG_5696 [Legionella drancourtii LLAP12]|uniref:Uncharacterized protein n=1 Tax=Legionella drancourtii LLAP12 TaxID=658187 RepID=G9EKG4_9GAMM|nr:hypothetical protein LDG_5696 [Legionella drancourtii LLAP12]